MKCLELCLVYSKSSVFAVIITCAVRTGFLKEASELTLQSGGRQVCLLVFGQLARTAEQLLDDSWTHLLKVLLRNGRKAVP